MTADRSEPTTRQLPRTSRFPHWHGFWNVEDPHGRAWRAGRAHYWFRFGEYLGDAKRSLHVGLEWSHGPVSGLGTVGGKLSTTGEETLDVHVHLGPLARWYLAVDYERLVWKEAERPGPDALVAPGGICAPTSPMYRLVPLGRYESGWVLRLFHLPPVRFEFDLGLTHVEWCVGPNDQSWSADAPWRERLRRNRLTWWRYAPAYRRGEPEVHGEVLTAVYLPEGNYPLRAKLTREVRQPRLGPLWMPRFRWRGRPLRGPSFWLPWGRRVHWTAAWEAPGGLPVPGKGENSWDCGPDAVYSSGVAVGPSSAERGDREWAAAAVADATRTVLRDRARYGTSLADTGA